VESVSTSTQICNASSCSGCQLLVNQLSFPLHTACSTPLCKQLINRRSCIPSKCQTLTQSVMLLLQQTPTGPPYCGALEHHPPAYAGLHQLQCKSARQCDVGHSVPQRGIQCSNHPPSGFEALLQHIKAEHNAVGCRQLATAAALGRSLTDQHAARHSHRTT
jgi:hypothetical protein